MTSSSRRRALYYRFLGADGALRDLLSPSARVLDVGCSNGRGSVLLSEGTVAGVDIYRPALEEARRTGSRRPVVQADIRSLPYRESSFDVCVALDVIEHFTKEEAHVVIAELERVAARYVCLLTPSGFVEQPPTPDEPWQEHRCGFEASELERLGYRVRGVGGHRALRRDYARTRFGPLGAALAVATTPILRRAPGLAYHLVAIKELRSASSS